MAVRMVEDRVLMVEAEDRMGEARDHHSLTTTFTNAATQTGSEWQAVSSVSGGRRGRRTSRTTSSSQGIFSGIFKGSSRSSNLSSRESCSSRAVMAPRSGLVTRLALPFTCPVMSGITPFTSYHLSAELARLGLDMDEHVGGR